VLEQQYLHLTNEVGEDGFENPHIYNPATEHTRVSQTLCNVLHP